MAFKANSFQEAQEFIRIRHDLHHKEFLAGRCPQDVGDVEGNNVLDWLAAQQLYNKEAADG